MQGITSRLKEIGHTHCAITDHASLSAIQPAYNSFSKAGIQLLPGCEFYIVPDMSNTKGMNNHVVVIARNKKGWENILKMNYLAYEKGSKMIYERQIGRIQMSVLEEFSEGLLISSACLAGIPAWALKSDKYEEAADHVKQMKKLFPESYFLEVQGVDFYNQLDMGANTLPVDKEWIEVQAYDQKAANDKIIDLGAKYNIPIVCTTDAHYVKRSDRDSHLLMLAVQSKTNIQAPALGSAERGARLAFEATPMLSTQELIDMFTETNSGFNGYDPVQVQEWIKNTQLAASLCEPASYLAPSGYKIPLFPINQSDDYTNFLKWRNSLEQEQIDGILQENSELLKSRLATHGDY
jgi:DNA polymerase III alpha subunit